MSDTMFDKLRANVGQISAYARRGAKILDLVASGQAYVVHTGPGSTHGGGDKYEDDGELVEFLDGLPDE